MVKMQCLYFMLYGGIVPNKQSIKLNTKNEPRHEEKNHSSISDQVRHKPDCTTTENARGPGSGWIVVYIYIGSENKGADQLRCCRSATFFFAYANSRFSQDAAQIKDK